MQEDVIKETLLNPSNDGTLTNEQLISNYINYAYSPKSIDWVDIEIGDTVLIKPEVDQRYVDILNKYPELYSIILGSINTDNIQEEDVLLAITQKLARFLKWNYGEGDFDENSLDYSNFAYFDAEDAIGREVIIEYTPLKLSTPEEYYKVKERYPNKIIKDFSKPRDLKPSSLKFTLANGEKRNQYDLDSVKLLFKYNELLEKGTIDNSSFTILEKFANYVIPEQDFRTAYTNKTYQKY